MNLLSIFLSCIVIPSFALLTGTSFAISFVSIFVYKPKELYVDEYEKNYLYIWKYDDEFDSLSHRILDDDELDKLKLMIIEEKTPDGNVTMTYNHKMGTFWYYSKNKNIAFKYLEVAAQKFVIQNDCKSVFIHDDHDNTEIAEDSDEDEKIVYDAVFVQPKQRRAKQIKIKKTNRFTYKGAEYIPPSPPPSKRRISFLDFKLDKKNI